MTDKHQNHNIINEIQPTLETVNSMSAKNYLMECTNSTVGGNALEMDGSKSRL